MDWKLKFIWILLLVSYVIYGRIKKQEKLDEVDTEEEFYSDEE